ncbi:MAG: SgcJ/EcaC family oxidoreductase [Acidimicrobiia bacterium]|nr:SgcJ/EcaC family oxidoreductase [Acidimicrobiia bacterium]
MRDQVRLPSDNLYAAWNAHDADAVAAVYAEGADFFDVVSSIMTKSRDEIRAHAVDCFAAFSDVGLARQTLLIDGNAGADRWVMRGTHTGKYQGVPATGNVMEVAGATFSEYDEDGLVICATNYVDVPAFLRQLGID